MCPGLCQETGRFWKVLMGIMDLNTSGSSHLQISKVHNSFQMIYPITFQPYHIISKKTGRTRIVPDRILSQRALTSQRFNHL